MMTGWQQIGGTWYYLKDTGAMATGWLNLNGTYYYLESWGGMATGWKSVNGSWYYLDPAQGGKMLANGWYWISGKCYYFYNWGGMAANTTIAQTIVKPPPGFPEGVSFRRGRRGGPAANSTRPHSAAPTA